MELKYHKIFLFVNIYYLNLELFQPGRMNADQMWKPNQQQENYPEHTISKTQTPRRAFKSLDDVIQVDRCSGPIKHSSYHVPPGKAVYVLWRNLLW